MFNPAGKCNIQLSVTQVHAGIERLPQQKFRLLASIKFEIGKIPVAKFVSRTIVNSFLAHFIITISDLPYILRYIVIHRPQSYHVCSHHH